MSTSNRTRNVLLLALVVLLVAPGCTRFKRWAYARGDRDEWQQPARVVETLGLEPGDRVADVGAGGGYFTFRLAEAVGPQGRVYAVDVDEAMQEALQRDVDERGLDRIRIVIAAPDDPGLEARSVDLVFTSNTYHHIGDRVAYFGRIADALDEGGRVAIVEYREGSWLGDHATPEDTIREEMAQAGYRLVASHDFLERQSFLVFEPGEDRSGAP